MHARTKFSFTAVFRLFWMAPPLDSTHYSNLQIINTDKFLLYEGEMKFKQQKDKFDHCEIASQRTAYIDVNGS